MRAQVLATVIALGSPVSLAACEWLYPSVSLSGADGSALDASSVEPGPGSSSGGEKPSGGGGSGSGGGAGSSSGSVVSGSSGATAASSSSGAGSSSGTQSASSSGGDAQGGSGGGSSSGAAGDAGTDDAGELAITFVQVASQDTGSTMVASISATYANPQREGDLNVVAVGWANPNNQINAISDSAGNTYAPAAPPGTTTDGALAVYYAKRVPTASSNTVTVDLSSNDFLSLAILEYAGASELDTTAVSMGSGTTASTIAVTTSLPGELVFGAGEPDQKQSTYFSSPGPGFDARVITSISGMIAEDMIAPQPGSYNASGQLTDSAPWVMQVATFK